MMIFVLIISFAIIPTNTNLISQTGPIQAVRYLCGVDQMHQGAASLSYCSKVVLPQLLNNPKFNNDPTLLTCQTEYAQTLMRTMTLYTLALPQTAMRYGRSVTKETNENEELQNPQSKTNSDSDNSVSEQENVEKGDNDKEFVRPKRSYDALSAYLSQLFRSGYGINNGNLLLQIMMLYFFQVLEGGGLPQQNGTTNIVNPQEFSSQHQSSEGHSGDFGQVEASQYRPTGSLGQFNKKDEAHPQKKHGFQGTAPGLLDPSTQEFLAKADQATQLKALFHTCLCLCDRDSRSVF